MSNISRRPLVLLMLTASLMALALPAFAEDTHASEKPIAVQTPSVVTPSEAKPAPRRARPDDIQRIFTIQYVDVRQLASVLEVFPAYVKESRDLGVIAVAAAPAVMAAIEETIKRLDVQQPSPKSIELTLYVIEAISKGEGPDDVPEKLREVVHELRRAFGYARYALMDVLVARGLEHTRILHSVKGSKAFSSTESKLHYDVSARRTESLDSQHSIRVINFEFHVIIPMPAKTSITTVQSSPEYQEARIRADLDIGEGQHVVVGKTGLGGPDNALILVLAARVVD